jgi:hypothetical protein
MAVMKSSGRVKTLHWPFCGKSPQRLAPEEDEDQ